MSITIIRIEKFVNHLLLITDKTIVSFHTYMMISIKIREKSLSKTNYIFNSKEKILLNSQEEFFNHIFTSKSIIVQIKNIFNRLFVIIKNYKIEKLIDYHENECFLISSKNTHLIIVFNKFFNQRVNCRELQDTKRRETILSNEIIVYNDKKMIDRITTIMNEYLDV